MEEKEMENVISAAIEIMFGVAIALFLMLYGLNIIEAYHGAIRDSLIISFVLFLECILKAIFQKKQSEKIIAALFAVDILLSCIAVLI